jgi:hypothetical protein
VGHLVFDEFLEFLMLFGQFFDMPLQCHLTHLIAD